MSIKAKKARNNSSNNNKSNNNKNEFISFLESNPCPYHRGGFMVGRKADMDTVYSNSGMYSLRNTPSHLSGELFEVESGYLTFAKVKDDSGRVYRVFCNRYDHERRNEVAEAVYIKLSQAQKRLAWIDDAIATLPCTIQAPLQELLKTISPNELNVKTGRGTYTEKRYVHRTRPSIGGYEVFSVEFDCETRQYWGNNGINFPDKKVAEYTGITSGWHAR